MRFITFGILILSVLMIVALPNWAATTLRPQPVLPPADLISGEWDVAFEVDNQTVHGTFILMLDGNQVTGAVYTQHTGPGTLSNGTWTDNKLSFTLVFAKHESIAVTGTAKDGKLSGEFRTEGMVGKWEAARK